MHVGRLQLLPPIGNQNIPTGGSTMPKYYYSSADWILIARKFVLCIFHQGSQMILKASLLWLEKSLNGKMFQYATMKLFFLCDKLKHSKKKKLSPCMNLFLYLVYTIATKRVYKEIWSIWGHSFISYFIKISLKWIPAYISLLISTYISKYNYIANRTCQVLWLWCVLDLDGHKTNQSQSS